MPDANAKELATLQRKAYDLYQLRWMADHGLALSDLLWSIIENLKAGIDPDDPDEDRISRIDPAETFVDWEADSGFDGSCWACKAEFLSTEWLDADYMERLLDPNDYRAYLRLVPRH